MYTESILTHFPQAEHIILENRRTRIRVVMKLWEMLIVFDVFTNKKREKER